MAWYEMNAGGVPASLKTGMNDVLNKKFGTVSQDYPPEDWPADVNLMGPLPEKTASGVIASFSDGADTVPVKSCKVAFGPGGGGGTPATPVAITGHIGMTISHAKKNLLPDKTYQRNANILRIGTDTLDGRLSLKAGTYTLSLTSDVVIGSLVYTIGGTSTGITFTSSGTRYYGSFTLSADTDDIFIHVYKSGGYTAENISDFMLEVGNTVSDYVAYSAPDTIAVSWQTEAGTVYGGELNVTTGVLKLTHELLTLDGSEDWQRSGTYNGSFYYDTATNHIFSSGNSLCSHLVQAYPFPANYASGKFGLNGANSKFLNIWIMPADSTVEELKTYLQTQYNNGTPVLVALELATPTEITGLTAHDIETNYADNNFYADIPDSTMIVEYRADISLALNA